MINTIEKITAGFMLFVLWVYSSSFLVAIALILGIVLFVHVVLQKPFYYKDDEQNWIEVVNFKSIKPDSVDDYTL